MFQFHSNEWLLLITWIAVLAAAVFTIRSKILSKEKDSRHQKIGLILFSIGDILMVVAVVLMVWLNGNAAQETFVLKQIMDVVYLPIYGFFLLTLLVLGLSVMGIGIIYFIQGRKTVQDN